MGRKFAVTFLVSSILLLVSTRTVGASLISIDEEGEIIINVLSAQEQFELEIPSNEDLEVKDVAGESVEAESKISLTKSDDGVRLNITTSSGEKNLNVSEYGDDVIEIQKRAQVEKLIIGVKDDVFVLSQGGVEVETSYEINIDPMSARLALTTPSGLKYLSILPKQAIETVLRSKIINRLTQEDKFQLNEEIGSELAYYISGDRVLNIFNVFEYEVPVKSRISASTGEILAVEQPTWLKVLGFIFS